MLCQSYVLSTVKPGFHKPLSTTTTTNFELNQSDPVGRMTAEPLNRFVFCVVVGGIAVKAWFPLSQLRPRQRPISSQNKVISVKDDCLT